MPIRAGELRHRCEVQMLTEGRGEHGTVTRTWSTSCKRWFAFVSTVGREFVSAQQINADLTHLLRMRYMADLTTSDRLLYDGRTFNILAIVDPQGRHEELLVSCKEAL